VGAVTQATRGFAAMSGARALRAQACDGVVAMGDRVEQTLAVLNGLVGDYLARAGNGLATDMALYRDGRALPLTRTALARAYPDAKARVVVLIHGLMCTERVWRMPDGSDYGSLLERERDVSALYVRYNSGLAIADNGARLASLLEALLAAYPVAIKELLLVGYSMGGLVVRSACHVASTHEQRHAWLERVRRIFYIGTPHLGAPAERAGKVVTQILQRIRDPYTQLIADLGNLRSAGMKDLGHADLRQEDRRDDRIASTAALRARSIRDARHPVPLLPGIDHYLIAGSLFADPRLALVFGDALVPVASATFDETRAKLELAAALPEAHVKIIRDVHHVALAHSPVVYAALRQLLEGST
jgi:pimeloyl-ACP methyl ester carboxylesterase